MLKRILCALLALALLASLTACKKSTGGSSSDEWEYEYETVTKKKIRILPGRIILPQGLRKAVLRPKILRAALQVPVKAET